MDVGFGIPFLLVQCAVRTALERARAPDAYCGVVTVCNRSVGRRARKRILCE